MRQIAALVASLVAALGAFGVGSALAAAPSASAPANAPEGSKPRAKKKAAHASKAVRKSKSSHHAASAPGEVYTATEGPDDGEPEVLPAHPIQHAVATVKLQSPPSRAAGGGTSDPLAEGSLAPEYSETREEAPLPPPAEPVQRQAQEKAPTGALRAASTRFDSVPEKEVSSLRKRLMLVDKLLQEFGRAYDYRVISVRELERIYAALKAEKKPAQDMGSPAPESAPESASRSNDGAPDGAASG